MKKLLLIFIVISVTGSCSDIMESGSANGEEGDLKSSPVSPAHTSHENSPWVTAYLASYMHYVPPENTRGVMPTEAIDWSAFTHLIYFALKAQPDGSLTGLGTGRNMTPAGVRAIVSAGQENGVPVLICIGGWGNYSGFSRAIQPGSRSNFVNNIVNAVVEWGFDGVDVNMEPIEPSDRENYAAFVNELYDRLQTLQTPMLSRPLMTAAVHWEPELISSVQDRFDQINIMTYNLSGPWTDWVTWHNSPLHNGGYNFPGYERELPSVNMDVDEYLMAGIQSEKLGIGIQFYGHVWSGVSRPQERWSNSNPPHVESEVPYSRIMDAYYQPGYYRWDDTAQAPYLSIETGNRRQFVSYDNEQAIELKSELVSERNLGGTIIWELGGGYRGNQSSGERDRLLQTVKESFHTTGSHSRAPDPEPEDNPGPENADPERLTVFDDGLARPWINTSWNTSVDFNSQAQAYEGTQSIRIDQNAWGGLSLRHGSWGSPVDIKPDQYGQFEFAVYAVGQSLTLDLQVQNSDGASFPMVRYGGTITPGEWTLVSVPMTDLNPGRRAFHRLNILESSGQVKSFFVDAWRLTGTD